MMEEHELTARPGSARVDATVVAVRRLLAELLRAGDAAAQIGDVADELNVIADKLAAVAPPMADRMVDMWHGEGVTRHDPVTGPENAIAPPLRLVGLPDGSVRGEAILGLPYQGPPGCVHGGISALLLDHTLGVANAWAGTSGMTANLELRYHRPTPLFEQLTVLGRQVRVDGRKIFTEGRIMLGDEVCVSANGLFIDKQIPRPRQSTD
ncbi:MAG: PaaI family thioesterase [Jatrophihabitans sp.]